VFYCGCHEEFKDFFSLEDGAVFCNDVCSIMEVLGHEYNPDQQHPFIDSLSEFEVGSAIQRK